MSKIKAILFDMDGVLIDAKEWHYEALNKALHLFGMEISRYDHLITYDGLPTKRKLEMLTKERELPKGLHSFINKLKQQFTLELIHTNCKPFFEHEYALTMLKKNNYLIGLCSNSIRMTVEVMLKKAMILDYFDITLSNEEVKLSKPDPEIYLSAMKKLNVLPKETLILEDNEHGIKAAIASGAYLLRIETIHDVTLEKIMQRIKDIEEELT